VVGRCRRGGRSESRRILGFRVDRGLFGEVGLHGFHETDEIAALESMGMRLGSGDLRTG